MFNTSAACHEGHEGTRGLLVTSGRGRPVRAGDRRLGGDQRRLGRPVVQGLFRAPREELAVRPLRADEAQGRLDVAQELLWHGLPVQTRALQLHARLVSVGVQNDIVPAVRCANRRRESAEVVGDDAQVQDVLPVVPLAAQELPAQPPLDEVLGAGVDPDHVHRVPGRPEDLDALERPLAAFDAPREHDDVAAVLARLLQDLRLDLLPVTLDGAPGS
mmetsp:Transcript_41731/g.110226  ORF Transcript_41731/g.110226 Transcript_41731/m.110226 type:complete len:217 (+) Transcript_41731:95-745(+)